MRKLWWSARKRLLRLDPRPRVVERRGARWELDPRDWLDMRLLMNQPFEAAQIARFTQLIETRRPALFLDVGANVGLYSVLMARAFPDLSVRAFEPVRRTRAKLARNLALNGLETRVQVSPLALSDSAGRAEIRIDPHSTGLSTLSASDDEAARRHFEEVETIQTARLDDLLSASGERLILKVDVEGHELAALEGMRRTLSENACALQVETRERNADALDALMDDMGYRRIGRIAEDAYFARD